MKPSSGESNIKIKDIMSTNVVSLDISKTTSHAANLMTAKRIGSIIITKDNKPFGIITERDLVRRYARGALVKDLASYPLITADYNTPIEKVVKIMLNNGIRKIPIVDQNNNLVGIVTTTDLVKFLLPEIKSGLAFSILQTVTRGKGPKCDSCSSSIETQWCESCNRFMCLSCEDEAHTIDLP